ncbi:hydantoinase/oxoprolinase family protein [Desulfohalobium retbaense]|uniref:5-oxoprolinase (ATP-hydrolyzing) n=1 Tax=Desulfohalobium retbaense (strain ATCC 49708 / DSM 5692 / JCM 16813 / HR100) TaxID=485915 RepID=C8WYU1_DESRD|nr:hydantoinase/oxoprolinase family protein [Desulfohalobium retbaense]ACV67857.1 5-oxoprolinase (ATP-hydrolyzing) [Desulfohalobium retbaense DSM 5692]
MVIIGVDTGGTFTDFIYKKDGEWGVYKTLSTPDNPARAVIEGLKHIAQGREMQVVHGSTVATNAVLERKGVPTAIVTNAGFEDLLHIGRQNRGDLYDLSYTKPAPIVDRCACYGVPGRIDSNGEERDPVDLEAARKVVQELQSSGIESVAVCFLFSYLNPSHEQAVQSVLEELEIPVSASHQILAEFREVERLSTTVVNAYVSPKMSRYLDVLKEFTGEKGLRVMQSNGGSISVDTAMQESVRTILSGPAGGVVGALELGRAAGFEKLITFDMGGTSSDVSLINGELPLSLETTLSGYPLKVPMLDIHTVGAGGGSIATLDAGGSLKVGPESAGADPGPICYGKGAQITVTDANLFLSRLIADRFLGGAMQLDGARMDAAFADMAEEAGLSALALGEGILDVANTNMERAIRVISVERGFDPREFTLFSFGGAGGLHCAFLARLLSMPRVLIPKNPGILSAVGMSMADVIKDYSQTVMLPGMTHSGPDVENAFAPLEQQAATEMADEGFAGASLYLERFVDMRYQGQSFEIIVPFDEAFLERFGQMHEQKYGYCHPGKPTEIVNLRLRARGVPEKPVFSATTELSERIPEEAWLDTLDVVFEGQSRQTWVVQRDRLLPGNRFEGPAIVVEYTSTIVVPPFACAEVDPFGNLLLHIRS